MYQPTTWRDGDKERGNKFRKHHEGRPKPITNDIEMSEEHGLQYNDKSVHQTGGNILDRIKKKPRNVDDTEMSNIEGGDVIEEERRDDSKKHKRIKKTEQELDPDWLPYEEYEQPIERTKTKKKKLGGNNRPQQRENAAHTKETPKVVKETTEPKPKIDLNKSIHL
jgi:hypothetical protein